MITRFMPFFSLLCILLLTLPSQANLFSATPKFLPNEQAFSFSHQYNQNELRLHWDITEGYYLYKKEIQIKAIPNKKLIAPQFPQPEQYHDEFFGIVDIYRHQLNINLPIAQIQPNKQIEVSYQGCTKGFCYPPETVTLDLQAVNSTPILAENQPDPTAYPSPETEQKAEQNKLASQLSHSPFAIFGFFILGLGLAFTPCVLPMLPLLSAVVIGRHQQKNTLKALALSFTYVQGMALTYTLLGLIVASIGLPFQIALQSPPMLIALSVLFILLSLSMFGLFTLELPHRLQQKLNQLSQKQQGGAYPSVFLMGMIAGLVASPCTSAPLSGALLYVAQSGNLVTGGLALYLLALGMGVPLILITLFGHKILPKSGDWLLKVKTFFGFIMLALPIFLLSRLLQNDYELLMWSAWAIILLIWLNEQFSANTILKKILRVILLLTLATSAKPWTDFLWSSTQQTDQAHFIQITDLNALQYQLESSKGKKIMVDLYADWCVACKEFEKYTFSDLKVRNELDKMVILQIDMTRNSPANSQIMKHFNILGLPTILFFNEQGTELSQLRVTGFMNAELFLDYLKNL